MTLTQCHISKAKVTHQWRIQNSTWGVFSRPEGPSGKGTGGVSPPVGGGSGGLPRENFEKIMQNGAIWSVIKAF